MPFLMYKDNDSDLLPSSYPCILGRALNQYRINTSVTIYIIVCIYYFELAIMYNVNKTKILGLTAAAPQHLFNKIQSYIDKLVR